MAADLSRLEAVACSNCRDVIPWDVVTDAPVVDGVRHVGCPVCGSSNSVDVAARARAFLAATRSEYDDNTTVLRAVGGTAWNG